MNPCELSMSIAALANAMACKLKSTEEISAFAAVFIQLGYTLETISTQKELKEKSTMMNRCCNSASKEHKNKVPFI